MLIFLSLPSSNFGYFGSLVPFLGVGFVRIICGLSRQLSKNLRGSCRFDHGAVRELSIRLGIGTILILRATIKGNIRILDILFSDNIERNCSEHRNKERNRRMILTLAVRFGRVIFVLVIGCDG